MRCLWLFFVLMLSACAPSLAPQQLPTGCQGDFSAGELQSRQWLQQEDVWRLRQGALLEIGMKKIPLEGFLRLDLKQRTARLVALNEIGLVLFDLQVSPESSQLMRAIPQLEKREGFTNGIAVSLRRMFLPPAFSDNAEIKGADNLQEISVTGGGAQSEFRFDCHGDLRELTGTNGDQNWRVRYNDYGVHDNIPGFSLPEETIYYDRSHALKLTLWLREARQEP